MRLAASAVVGSTLLLVAAGSRAQPAATAPDVEAPLPDPTQAPPPPPSPGLKQSESDPPAASPSVFGSGEEGEGHEELAGFQGGFFLRDRRDYFRLFPEALLEVDLNGSFGPGVGSLPADRGGNEGTTRLELKRARFGLEGEVLRRWIGRASCRERVYGLV